MAPNWTRLIRFETTDGSIVYGEPIATEEQIMKNEIKQAKVIEGGPLGNVTDKVVDVKNVSFVRLLIVTRWLRLAMRRERIGGIKGVEKRVF